MKYFAVMKPLTLIGSSILIIVILFFALAFISKEEEIPEKHFEVVLRDLGHQLLLSAKDSTSRVLPVKKLSSDRYQISFQNEFALISDSLINIVQRTFHKNITIENYIVSLKNCTKNETVLAFEINSNTGDLAPCRGRKLPASCYNIEIELLNKNAFNPYWLLLLIIPLGIAGLYAKKKSPKKEEHNSIADTAGYTSLGRFKFYPDNNVLKLEDKIIELSEKETIALKIFAENSNQVVEREKLMKEIWEDKGIVVISRNVDVLVSKLRKKLIDDTTIKLINVPGRGYKFILEREGV